MSLATQSSDPPGSSSSGLSAFKTVGSQLSVSAGAIKPASSPLTRSPVTNRKHTRDSSDQETEEDNDRPVSPSSEDGSAPVTPTPGAAAAVDTFSWPSHVQCDENRQLLGTEEESSERQSSEDESQEREKNIWSITREQLNYYMTQFRSMQPNPHGESCLTIIISAWFIWLLINQLSSTSLSRLDHHEQELGMRNIETNFFIWAPAHN